jgi:hypothetical protein
METHRLKMRIGPHEFEAEGTEEAVDRRLDAFKQLIAQFGPQGKANPPPPAQNGAKGREAETPTEEHNPLSSIFRVEGKAITLTARPSDREDALLLLLLAHKSFRGADLVPVSDLLAGIKLSGFTVERMDDVAPKLVSENLLLKIGQRNGSKYRLTTPGTQKAQALAESLMEKVA